MKIMILAVCAAIAVILTGCKTVPTTEQMYSTSKCIGVAAGMVANLTKIDDASRNAVVEIVNEVVACVPETNQTFEAAWTPIAQAHTDKLIADGKITKEQGVLVMSAFGLVVKGIDYVFEVRYPKARQYKDLTVAAIDGFASGFLAVFKPVNTELKTLVAVAAEYDVEAYEALKSASEAGGAQEAEK